MTIRRFEKLPLTGMTRACAAVLKVVNLPFTSGFLEGAGVPAVVVALLLVEVAIEGHADLAVEPLPPDLLVEASEKGGLE